LLGELNLFKFKLQVYKNQDKFAGDILGYWWRSIWMWLGIKVWHSFACLYV